MKRRDFLTTAAATTGYSMFIKLDAQGQGQDKRTAERIRQKMQPVAPAIAPPPFRVGCGQTNRLHVKETNGDKMARLFEMRCYA